MCSEFWPRDVRTMGIKMAPLNRDLIDSLHPILEVVLFFYSVRSTSHGSLHDLPNSTVLCPLI